MTEPKNACEEMKRVYEFYSGRKFNELIPKSGKGKVKLIHYVQSFSPEDKIFPENANCIALATVSDMFGENVQAVAATHVDTHHIHNHIIINVYDLEGNRFYSNQTTLKKLKLISDAACLRHGIKSYDKTAETPKPKISAYNEWEHKKNGTSWKQKIREEIDGLVSSVGSFDELMSELEQRGYTIKRGKYISVKAQGQERFVRTKTLGEDYTEENLVRRISEAVAVRENSYGEKFRNGYKNLGERFIRGCGAYCITKPAKATHNFYYGQYVTLVKEHLNSIEMVREKLYEAVELQHSAEQVVNEVVKKRDEMERVIRLATHYFNDMKGMPKIFPKTKMDKSAVAVVKEYNLNSLEDLGMLREKVSGINIEISALREKLDFASDQVKKYRDIVVTYEMINSGEDYISRLVREAKEQADYEDWNNAINLEFKAIRKLLVNGRLTGFGDNQKAVANAIISLSKAVPENNSELNKLIRSLAIMRVDNIVGESDADKLIGKMKASEISARKEMREIKKKCDDLATAISRCDVYVRFKDSADYPNKDWLNTCRGYAEKYNATDMAGFERLKSERDDLEKQLNTTRQKENYYYNRAVEYEEARGIWEQACRDGYVDMVVEKEKNVSEKGEREVNEKIERR